MSLYLHMQKKNRFSHDVVHISFAGVDTDEFENMSEEDYDEEIVEFLLKVEEIILDEE